MCFTPDARGTEYSNSVPAGTEFQNDHGCEARGVHFSLGPGAYIARGFQTLFIMKEEGVMLIKTSGIDPLRYYDIFEILSLPVQNYNFLSL